METSIDRRGPTPMTEAGGLRNAKVLVGFARPHRRSILLGLALALCGSATVLATPMVTKWILDSLGTGASMQGRYGF
ncbi:hypothetical protein [Williamsia sp. 1135]|uniref:hypothetical protein n=1 Tax=Williamsia sp. 1135 TaxID=1889262 RepID=UPI001F0AE25D|nr:hypothetical protein [Williamsia sp. 1135]